MEMLSINYIPDTNNQMVTVNTIVTFKNSKKELYLCNNVHETFEAVAGTDKFVAHEVIGMQPRQVVIDPSAVALVQIADR
jgi:hypothetical protein